MQNYTVVCAAFANYYHIFNFPRGMRKTSSWNILNSKLFSDQQTFPNYSQITKQKDPSVCLCTTSLFLDLFSATRSKISYLMLSSGVERSIHLSRLFDIFFINFYSSRFIKKPLKYLTKLAV